VHDPIIGVLDKYLFGPMALSPLATFALTLAAGLPLILALCYGFHLVFEAPFLRRRDLGAFRNLPAFARLRRLPAPRQAASERAGG